jgi:hypothetical protein
MSGAILHSPNTPSWNLAQFKKSTGTLPFTFNLLQPLPLRTGDNVPWDSWYTGRDSSPHLGVLPLSQPVLYPRTPQSKSLHRFR